MKYKVIVIISFLLGGLIFGTIGVYAATTLASSSVSYSNTTSGGSSTNVQGAIDELYNGASIGKSNIINSLNDKGLSLASNSTYQQIVNGIDSLEISAFKAPKTITVTHSASTLQSGTPKGGDTASVTFSLETNGVYSKSSGSETVNGLTVLGYYAQSNIWHVNVSADGNIVEIARKSKIRSTSDEMKVRDVWSIATASIQSNGSCTITSNATVDSNENLGYIGRSTITGCSVTY